VICSHIVPWCTPKCLLGKTQPCRYVTFSARGLIACSFSGLTFLAAAAKMPHHYALSDDFQKQIKMKCLDSMIPQGQSRGSTVHRQRTKIWGSELDYTFLSMGSAAGNVCRPHLGDGYHTHEEFTTAQGPSRSQLDGLHSPVFRSEWPSRWWRSVYFLSLECV
jgi:hypothetical protein